jgi:hypothetical protein
MDGSAYPPEATPDGGPCRQSKPARMARHAARRPQAALVRQRRACGGAAFAVTRGARGSRAQVRSRAGALRSRRAGTVAVGGPVNAAPLWAPAGRPQRWTALGCPHLVLSCQAWLPLPPGGGKSARSAAAPLPPPPPPRGQGTAPAALRSARAGDKPQPGQAEYKCSGWRGSCCQGQALRVARKRRAPALTAPRHPLPDQPPPGRKTGWGRGPAGTGGAPGGRGGSRPPTAPA